MLKQLDCQAPLWGTYHYGGEATPLLVAQALLGEAAKYRDVTTAADAGRSRRLFGCRG